MLKIKPYRTQLKRAGICLERNVCLPCTVYNACSDVEQIVFFSQLMWDQWVLKLLLSKLF